MVEVIPPNGLQSTLAADITAAATQLSIQAADAPGWPSSGTYRCVLFNDANAGPFEIVTVTGGQGTATLTVARASEPYNGVQAARVWVAGTNITPVFTTAGMSALLSSAPNAPGSKLLLDWASTTDIAVGAAIAATTWTDVPGSSQSFTVDDPRALVRFEAGGCLLVGGAAGSAQDASARLVVDATPQPSLLGVATGFPAGYFGNPLGGAAPYAVTGLAVGVHTVKLQVWCSLAGSINCRSATHPNTESLALRVIQEPQRTSGGASSTTGGSPPGFELVLAASAPSVTLPVSGILPQNYRNLRITWQAASDGAARTGIALRCNGDAGANYYRQNQWGGQGSAGAVGAQNLLDVGYVCGTNAPAGSSYSGRIDIPNYSGATLHHSLVFISAGRSAAADDFFLSGGGEWVNPGPITTITLQPNAGNFVAGSVFTLTFDGLVNPPTPVDDSLRFQVVLAAATPTVRVPVVGLLPQNYGTMRVQAVGRGDAAQPWVGVGLQFNGDTGANYALEDWGVGGTVGGPTGSTGQTSAKIGNLTGASAPAGNPGMVEAVIPGYSGTVWRKIIAGRSANRRGSTGADLWTEAPGSFWDNASAITSVVFVASNGNFLPGTVFTVWFDGWANPPVAAGPLTLEVVLAAAQPSVTLPVVGQLPQGYRHLTIKWQAKSDANATYLTLRCNGDAGPNYDWSYVQGFPSGTGGGGGMGATAANVGDGGGGTAANDTPGGVISIPNYSGSVFNKSIVAESVIDFPASAAIYVKKYGGAWRSTQPITSITLLPSLGNFLAGSVFTLTFDGAVPPAPAPAAAGAPLYLWANNN